MMMMTFTDDDGVPLHKVRLDRIAYIEADSLNNESELNLIGGFVSVAESAGTIMEGVRGAVNSLLSQQGAAQGLDLRADLDLDEIPWVKLDSFGDDAWLPLDHINAITNHRSTTSVITPGGSLEVRGTVEEVSAKITDQMGRHNKAMAKFVQSAVARKKLQAPANLPPLPVIPRGR